MLGNKATGRVLSVARQRGGVMPSVVTLHDFSRFGNHGAMTDVTWVQLPSGLWVMSFNGTSSNVDCGNDNSFDYTHQITATIWVNVTQFPSGDYCLPLSKGAGTSWGIYLYDPQRRPRFIAFGLSRAAVNGADNSLIEGKWQLIGGVYDGARLYVYVDGSGWSTPSDGPLTISTRKVVVGAHDAAPGYDKYLEGFSALPRVYNYALTPAQIRAKFTSTRRLFGV